MTRAARASGFAASRRKYVVSVAAIALMLALQAAPAAAQDEDGAYGPEDACSVSAETEDFGIVSSTPLLPSSDESAPQPTVYSLCPAEAYFLTYVDARGVLGTLAEAVTTSGTGVLESAQKTGTNAIASWVFVTHAKLVAITINVMLWAFDFNAVEIFEGPVEAVVRVLGQEEGSPYQVLLPIVYVLAVGYAAWISIGRNEVANGLAALLKSAVVGAVGAMVIANPLGTVQIYQDTINNITGQVFRMVDGIAKEQGAGENGALPPPTENTGPYTQDPLSNVSQTIWLTYVEIPWSRLQISSTNAGVDENGEGGIADEYAHEILRIRYPDDRAKYLCDLGGADCGGLFGDNNGGDVPDETTGGETTGGEETTDEGGSR